MSIVNRLRDLTHRTEKQSQQPSSSESLAKETTPEYPAYYYELDDVQKQIYHSPFGPDGYPIDAWTDPYYETWFLNHKATEDELNCQRATWDQFSLLPKFSIIVPLYKTPLEYLHTMVDSVLAQTYGKFQLVLVNASPELSELVQEVELCRVRDNRIAVVNLEHNLGITENTNRGLEVADGDFCCFLDHDDFIEPNLLFEYACAIEKQPDTDILYCDEDLVELDSESGQFHHLHPMFKPQFSPELLLCKNYVVHFMAIRRSLVLGMEHRDSRFDGTQDYNMLFNCSESARRITAVNKVLYHWRVSEQSTATNPDAKPYSRHSYKLSVLHHLNRANISASIIPSDIPNNHTLWFRGHDRKVTLIIDCVATGENIEHILEIVEENGAEDCFEILLNAKTSQQLDSLNLDEGTKRLPHRARILDAGDKSSLIERLNKAASTAEGDYLVFLNGAFSFVTAEPLQQLTGLCALDGVGVTSPRILYRNGNVKSFGVAVTAKRIMPMYRGYPNDFPAYQCNARVFQNVSACSLQGMCISRNLFLELGGLDERFEGEIAAVDLCKRVRNQGYRIAITPTVEIEMSERPLDDIYNCATNAPEYTSHDLEAYDEKWHGARQTGDPYLNVNLDQASPYFQLPRP